MTSKTLEEAALEAVSLLDEADRQLPGDVPGGAEVEQARATLQAALDGLMPTMVADGGAKDYEVTAHAQATRTIHADTADAALAEFLGRIDFGDTDWEGIQWEVVE